ncbi:MAG: carbohydrate kinase [Bacteroidota bacterium]
MIPDKNYECISIGEILVDLVTTEYVSSLAEAATFQMHPGGSPANLASNLARLGRKAAVVGTVGDDGPGKLIEEQLKPTGLDLTYLRKDERPTTLILVTKSHNLPAFSAYREADLHILPEQLPEKMLESTRLFHTTAFALSKQPARNNIFSAAVAAKRHGAQLSIDANYAQKIWPDRTEAQSVIHQYLELGALAKFSEVDYERLYGSQVEDPWQTGRELLKMGAKLICLTMGAQGAYLLTNGEEVFIPSREIEVVDTTGAGDAFWAGFLHAWLNDESLENCGKNGRQLAEKKLTRIGPLPNHL